MAEEINQDQNFSKGFGIAGFVLGILGILLLVGVVVFSLLGLVFSLLGIVFSIIQIKKGRTGMAVAGLVLNIIGLSIFLINLVATTIVWGVITPGIKANLNEGFPCFGAGQVVIEDNSHSCWDKTTNQVKIQIGRGPKDFVLAGVHVLISEARNTTSKNVISGLPSPNKEKIISVAYSNSSVGGPESVSIAPTIKVGNTKYLCPVSSTLTLKSC